MGCFIIINLQIKDWNILLGTKKLLTVDLALNNKRQITSLGTLQS
jgi:hypothetical protein